MTIRPCNSMSTVLRLLQALHERLDTILFGNPYAENFDEETGVQPQHIGSMAGGAGGLAAGAALPNAARATMRRIPAASPLDRVTSKVPRPIRAANRLANRKVARLGGRG